MRKSILVVAACSLTLAWANAKPAPDEPFLLEPLKTPARMQLSDAATEKWIFHALDLSERGDYVVLAAGSAAVDVWSVQSGAKTASLALKGSERAFASAALAGDPCVAVVGRMESTTADKKRNVTNSPLQLLSCATGVFIATISEHDLPSGGLLSLTAASACGVVVAQFENGTAVVDVGSRQLRPDLAKLISDALPIDENDDWRLRSRWVFKAPASDQPCVVYGASLELKKGSTTIVPGRLFAFDFQAKKARLLKSYAYARGIEGMELKQLFPAAKMAISPSGQIVALYFSRDGGIRVPFQQWPPGTADVLLTDIRNVNPESVIDTRGGATIRDLALLSDDELLLLSNWLDDFHASVENLKSGKARMLCSGGFGDILRKGKATIYGRRSPSAIAVDSKLGLVAAVINDHIRVLRYKRNPMGVYGQLGEC